MKVYTDGATSNNIKDKGYGGWAFAIINDVDNIISIDSGYVPNATNNICELTAMIEACKTCTFPIHYTIYSDSAYIINCYNQKWYKKWQMNGWVNSRREPVANRHLWEQLIPYFERSNFSFEKVRGHNGDKWNEYVDKLAVEAKSKRNKNEDLYS